MCMTKFFLCKPNCKNVFPHFQESSSLVLSRGIKQKNKKNFLIATKPYGHHGFFPQRLLINFEHRKHKESFISMFYQ